LLNAAEAESVDILLTTDRRLRYQQNLRGRRVGIIVLTGSTKWSRVCLEVDRVVAAVEGFEPGSYVEIEIPFGALRR
jgi:hypothetical protein